MARVETLALVLLQAAAVVVAWRVWQLHTDKEQMMLQVSMYALVFCEEGKMRDTSFCVFCV